MGAGSPPHSYWALRRCRSARRSCGAPRPKFPAPGLTPLVERVRKIQQSRDGFRVVRVAASQPLTFGLQLIPQLRLQPRIRCNAVLHRRCAMPPSKRTTLSEFKPGLANLPQWQSQKPREMSSEDYGMTLKPCSDSSRTQRAVSGRNLLQISIAGAPDPDEPGPSLRQRGCS